MMREVTITKRRTLACVLALAFAVGCAGSDRNDEPRGQAGAEAGAGGRGGNTAGIGGNQAGAGGRGGNAGTGGQGGVADVGGSGGSGGQGGATANNEWCAVEQIMQDRCVECHGEQPTFGAPMPLVSHEDLTAPSPTDGRPMPEVVMARVTGEETPRMPQTPNDPLTEEQIADIRAWIEAGTPNAARCSNGAGGTGGTGGAGGSGGTGSRTRPEYSCENGDPIQFRAHNAATPDDATPFDASHVGGSATGGDPNLYQCFYFKTPWPEGSQGIGFKPLIDNDRILHHWLLYASENAPPDISDGGMRADCQFQGDTNRTLLAGWAPGTPAQNMPSNVGMELPSGNRGFLTLEIHYYNTDPGQPAEDRSGVELCLANEKREHTATQHWLGTENINVEPNSTGMASDTCTPNLAQGETSTLISVTPHMHKIGTHATLELVRADGTRKMLHDEPFDFENQTTYMFPEPVEVRPGDHLETTCEYKNTGTGTVNFGEGSDEEMCYLFTTAYPAGSLHNGKNGCFGIGCVPGGPTRCIDNESPLHVGGGI